MGNEIGKRLAVWLCAAGALTACGVERVDAPTGVERAAVIAGSRSDAFEYPISELERNAALAQVVTVGGKQYQGCSATLIGDRLVLTAGHCLVLNQGEWLRGGMPQLGEPGMLQYLVGEDVDAPLCRLTVESIHLNPEIKILPDNSLAHDSAIAVLSESATRGCPQAVPLAVNRQPIEPLIGRLLAQGGFGSLDETTNFSKVKFWSALELSRVNDALLFGRDVGHGLPSLGDSGSGALLRTSDGELRVLGTASTTWGNALGFSRLDKDGPFLDAMLTEQNVCGELLGQGVCRGDTLVQCTAGEMHHESCADRGLQCAGADAGAAAACACTCNQGALCEPACACDTDCAACACNTHDGCDEGCACDAACAAPPAPPASGCSATSSLTLLPALGLLALRSSRRRHFAR